MNHWKEKALDALHRSLHPVPQELNEIDWKGALSNKTDRLCQHTCALANRLTFERGKGYSPRALSYYRQLYTYLPDRKILQTRLQNLPCSHIQQKVAAHFKIYRRQ